MANKTVRRCPGCAAPVKQEARACSYSGLLFEHAVDRPDAGVYLVAIAPADRGSIRSRRGHTLRFGCYRTRAAAVRLAVSLAARPRGRRHEPAVST